MATRDDIKTMLGMFATLPNNPIKQDPQSAEAVVNLYFAALADVPVEFLEAAALQYLGADNRFFPSNPGTLREIAFDLEMVAQGVPTASQAWAMVKRGPAIIEARICQTNADLRIGLDGLQRDYFHRLGEIAEHEKTCDVCMPTSKTGSYGSNAVDQVVRLLGGPDVIMTDNDMADRARFIDGYRELILAERRRLQYHPKVQALIADPDRPRLGTSRALLALLADSLGGKK